MKANPNYTYLKEQIDDNRWVLLQGGTRSGKTYSTLQYIIWLCKKHPNAGMEIDIVRNTFKALKSTAWKDMQDLLEVYNIYDVRDHNRTDHIYKLFGNTINYYGADDPDKVHGRKRDIIFLNEANQIDEDTIDQLAPRTKYRIIADYNPAIGDGHWLDKYIEKFPPLITTYKDNPFLSKEQVDDIESKKDKPYWWAVYGTGHRAKREGVIFDYEVDGFDTSLPYYYGLDFGYRNDPDACVRVAIDEKRQILYCHEEFYEYGNSVNEIGAFVKSLPKGSFVADSAEARLIDHLIQKSGRAIRKVKKGAGSVLSGIRLMENYKIVITPSSKNLRTELNNYSWSTKTQDTPIDDFNHLIDGIRYVVNTYSSRQVTPLEPQNNISDKWARGEFTGNDTTPW